MSNRIGDYKLYIHPHTDMLWGIVCATCKSSDRERYGSRELAAKVAGYSGPCPVCAANKKEAPMGESYTEFFDPDSGDTYYLDDNGDLRRMAKPKPKVVVYTRGKRTKPFTASPVPDTLREWVEGKQSVR